MNLASRQDCAVPKSSLRRPVSEIAMTACQFVIMNPGQLLIERPASEDGEAKL